MLESLGAFFVVLDKGKSGRVNGPSKLQVSSRPYVTLG